MAIEEPDFDVLAERESYEVRRYESYLVAEVDVVGDGSDGRAFRILARYDSLSMAVTFPFNLVIGIPLYHAAARLLGSA